MAMDSVALGSSMRANLLSLQNTNSLLDATQFKLSTGRKVNSALDNAQSFFAAQSLTNRANDLSRLLDSMGQSIQTIKEADTAVSSLTTLVEQADAIATQAQEEITSAGQEAKATGNRDLSGLKDVDTDFGVADGSTITFTVTDPTTGSAVTLAGGGAVTISDGESIEQLITEINDLDDGLSEKALEATLNSSGQLEIKAVNGGTLRMVFEDVAVGTADDSADRSVAEALGFGELAETTASGAGGADPNVTAVTVSNTAALTSFALYDGAGDIATRSTALTALDNSAGTDLVTAATAGSDLTVGINGGTAQTVVSDINGATVQDLIDGINTNATLKGKVEATYDEDTGEISLRAVDASVNSIQFGLTDDADNDSTVNLGFGTQALDPAASSSVVENIRLGAAAGNLASLEADYNKVRSQIDELVADAGYRGVNLLNGDDLTTIFNEDRTSSLTTEGVNFTSSGLGMSAANFASSTRVSSALSEVDDALTSVRNFGSSIGNDLAILQNREDFTKQTINTLEEGADKLTLADPNEEGAKMLALQTQLQLGVTSLALASQSAQSVLSLF